VGPTRAAVAAVTTRARGTWGSRLGHRAGSRQPAGPRESGGGGGRSRARPGRRGEGSRPRLG
jgi:hypothetical protein